MQQLGSKKQMLLDQVKRNPGINLQQLVQLTQQYSDLQPSDFEGVIAPEILAQLMEAGRDPQEVQLWNDIQNAPCNTPEDVQQAQRLVAEYMQRYPGAPKQAEATPKQTEAAPKQCSSNCNSGCNRPCRNSCDSRKSCAGKKRSGAEWRQNGPNGRLWTNATTLP